MVEHSDNSFTEIINQIDSFVSTAWSRKKAIFAFSVLFTIFLAVLLLVVLLLMPKSICASSVISINFKGSQQGTYPNGTKFSPLDLMADSVLETVYKDNNLSKYCKFSDFKRSLSAIQESYTLDSLDSYFAKRLAAKQLTEVDRKKIDDEYVQRRNALLVPEYKISLDLGKVSIPRNLAKKIVSDIPERWIEEQKDERGIERYDVPMITSSMINDIKSQSSELTAYDLLNIIVRAAYRSMNDIEQLPAVNQIRVDNGTLSFNDIHCEFDMFNANELLMLRIFMLSSPSSLGDAELYLTTRINECKRQINKRDYEKSLFDNAYQAYIKNKVSGSELEKSVAPASTISGGQAGAASPIMLSSGTDMFSVMAKLLEDKQDVLYRQNLIERGIVSGRSSLDIKTMADFYEELLKDLKNTPKSQAPVTPERLLAFRAFTCDKLEKIIGKLNKFYSELSRLKLGNQQFAYDIKLPPRIEVEWSIPKKTFALAFITIFIIGELVIVGFAATWRKGSSQAS